MPDVCFCFISCLEWIFLIFQIFFSKNEIDAKLFWVVYYLPHFILPTLSYPGSDDVRIMFTRKFNHTDMNKCKIWIHGVTQGINQWQLAPLCSLCQNNRYNWETCLINKTSGSHDIMIDHWMTWLRNRMNAGVPLVTYLWISCL